MTRSGELRSLPPRDYDALPPMEAPAGYICLIRDIDAESYRIDATGCPRDFVAALLDESERSFGLELVSVLKTEDLQASKAQLYQRHHARLSEDWLRLDAYQLAELRRSILRIDAYPSQYLRPPRNHKQRVATPRAEIRYGTLMTSNLGAPGSADWRERPRSRPTLLPKKYGAASLRPRPQPASAGFNPIREAPSSLRALIEGRIKYLIWNDPGCLLLVWIGLLALGLAYLIFVSIRAFVG